MPRSTNRLRAAGFYGFGLTQRRGAAEKPPPLPRASASLREAAFRLAGALVFSLCGTPPAAYGA